MELLNSEILVVGQTDGKLTIWNVTNRTLIKSLDDNYNNANGIALFDSNYFATGSNNSKIILWKDFSNSEVLNLGYKIDFIKSYFGKILFARTGNTFIELYSQNFQKLGAVWIGCGITHLDLLKNIYNTIVCGCSNGQLNFVGRYFVSKFYNSGKAITCLKPLTGWYIAYGLNDKTIRIFNTFWKIIIKSLTLEDHASCLEEINQQTIAVGLQNGKIQLWDKNTGQLVKNLVEIGVPVTAIKSFPSISSGIF